MDLSRASWHKSSRSNANSQCVEVAQNLAGVVALRDSKDPQGPVLVFTADGWRAFTRALKGGTTAGADGWRTCTR